MNVITLFTVGGVIFYTYRIVRKHISVSEGLLPISFIALLGFLGTTMYYEVGKYQESGAFYGADIQSAIGIYCVDGKVEYRAKDSIKRQDYGVHSFNENAFNGSMKTTLTCKEHSDNKPVFYDQAGSELSYDQVLRIVNDNVNSGFFVSSFK
ncbi:hypothetical protein [Serratia fonticola]|uniref:hypothetical protein n=1 Tax=Serratia fonticola TaxID=47917 RepID=UPI001C44EFA6|nr:hypothetical protein [Serratia fonticola]QXN65244.1 hypothetical protein J8M99_26140 [Serratia fonticola]